MERYNQQQLKSATVTQEFLNEPDNKAIWDGVSALVQQMDIVNGKLELTETIIADQTTTTKGVTKNKRKIRDLLISTTYVVGSMTKAWAMLEDEPEIIEKVNYSKSALAELGFILPERAQVIHDVANEHIVNLADFGLTAEKLTELQNRVTAYEGMVVAPRSATVARKTLTELLRDEVRELMWVFREVIDPLMAQFEEEHPEFYLGYRNARKIGKTPVNPRKPEESLTGRSGLSEGEEALDEEEGVVLGSGE